MGLSEDAIMLVDELHTERLAYDEYLILINALLKLQEYEGLEKLQEKIEGGQIWIIKVQ